MGNRRGAVIIPSPADAGRQHRERIRQLQANPSGAGGVDTPWFTIGAAGQPAYQLNWGAYTDAGDPTFPPVQYMRDRYGFGHLRGRLIYGNFGWDDYAGNLSHIPPQVIPVAFTLPVGFRPQSRKLFYAVDTSGHLVASGSWWPNTSDSGSGVGHVAVDASGDVSPLIFPTGLGATSTAFLAENFDGFLGVDGTLLRTAAWRNAIGNAYGYRNPINGGFGVALGHPDIPNPVNPFPGPDPLPPAALYLGTGPYADCSIMVTIQTASFVMLGLHCQATQFDPTTMNWPAGYWLGYSMGGGFFYIYYADGRGIYPIHGPISFNALAPNMQLMFSVNNYRASVTTFPGGTLGGFDLSPKIFGSGLFGLGASGVSAANVRLLGSQMKVSMSQFSSINLDGVKFSTLLPG